MKILLTFFALFFSSLVIADDISDYKIEKISVGDSLLEFYSKTTINKNLDTESNKLNKDKTFYSVTIEDKKFEKYDLIQIYLKTNDADFSIYSIAGATYFKEDHKEHR